MEFLSHGLRQRIPGYRVARGRRGCMTQPFRNDRVKIGGKLHHPPISLSKIATIEQKGDSKHPVPFGDSSGPLQFGPLQTEFKFIVLIDPELTELSKPFKGEIFLVRA